MKRVARDPDRRRAGETGGAEDEKAPGRLCEDGAAGVEGAVEDNVVAAEALEESEERFRALAENSADVIMRFDRQLRHLYVNRAVEAQTGIAAADFIGRTHEELGFPADLCRTWEHAISEVFATSAARRIEFELPSGVWIDWQLVPEFAPDGSVRAVMTAARDITDRKHVEDALERRVAARTEELGRALAALQGEVLERTRAQEAISESEVRLRTVVENMPAMMVAFDENARVVAWNRECERVLGYSAGEVIGEPRALQIAFPDPRYRRQVLRTWLEARGHFRDLEVEILCRNGSTRTVSWSSISADAPIKGWATWALGRDITEQRRAENALRESEQTARALLDAPTDVALLLDAAGTILAANEHAAQRLGVPIERLIGGNLFELVEPEVAARRRQRIEEVIATGAPVRFSDERLGSTFDNSFFPVFDAQGRVSRVAILARDVTDLVRAEEARARLATAVEQASEAIVITDVRGVVQYVNPAFEGISGYRAEEVIGQTLGIIKSGAQPSEFYRELWRTILGGDVWTGQFTNRRRDGTLYQEEATITPIRDGAGTIVGFVGVKRDVTREVALEQELRESQKVQAIGQLAGGVAHDFNNLLQALLGSVEMLKARSGDPEVLARTIAEIEADVLRGAALTRQLLVFARREVLKPQRLDLNAVVREMGTMLRRLVRENVRFTLALADEALPIDGDLGQLQQVVSNLALNAADAMPEGGQLVVRTGRTPAGEAFVAVEDNGRGIPDEIRARIFEPFFTTKAVGKGTGLGLTVVQAIVAGHGGRIEVETGVEEGSTFSAFFPARALPPSEPTRASVDPRADHRGAGERILIVEDESGAREGLHDMLDVLGYEPSAVASGEEALHLAEEQPFDLLLTDLVLPGLPGTAVAARLRARWPALKVVLMSGYAADAEVRAGVQCGAMRFLQKPFDMATLARELRAAIGAGEPSRPNRTP
ncbi:MAG: PAS domain S-box protein [Acidobacteriota bacterium]